MTQRLAIAHPLLSDAATMSSPSEGSTTTVVQQLQTMQPREPWRSLTNPNILFLYVEVDLGAGHDGWNLLWLGFNNARSETDTMRIRTADTQGDLTASPVMDTTVSMWVHDGTQAQKDYLASLPYVHSRHWLGDGTLSTERWVRIDFGVSVPGGSFFQAGRLYLSQAYRPPFDKSAGGTVQQRERGGKRTVTVGGTVRVRAGARYRVKAFTPDFLRRVEWLADAWAVHELRGESSDVLVMDDPSLQSADLMKTTFYGLLSPVTGTHRNTDVYDVRYQLETLED